MNTLTNRLKLLAHIVDNDESVWTLDTTQWTKKMWKRYEDEYKEVVCGD